MAIFVECGECGKKYRFESNMAGERVPCRKCGASLRVPGGRRGSARRGQQLNPVVIGGSVGFVAISLVGLMLALRRPDPAPLPAPQPDANVASVTNNQITAAPSDSSTSMPAAQPNAAQPNVASNSSTPTAAPPTRRVSSSSTPDSALPQSTSTRSSSGTFGNATKAAPPEQTTTVKGGWAVEVDAPREPLKLSQNRIQVPVSSWGSYVAMPQIVSPFVAVRAQRGLETTITVFNLETLKSGKPLVARGFAERCPITVSPDGKRVALIAGKSLSEWSAENGKLIHATQTEFEGSNRMFEYLDPTHIALAYEHDIAVYDMSTAKAESMLIPTSEDPLAKYAISPGGRYAAGYYPTTKTLSVFDLRSGKLAGELTLNREPGGKRCLAIAFSPEGDEVCVVVDGRFPETALLNFDVRTGQRLHRHEPKISFQIPWNAQHGQRQDVQFLGDKRGWMLFAQYLIDRDSGNLLNEVAGGTSNDMPWRVLPNDRLLVKQQETLRTVDISPQALAIKSAFKDGGTATEAVSLATLKHEGGTQVALPEELVSWQSVSDPAAPVEAIVDKAVLGYSDGGQWRTRLFPDRRHMLLIGTDRARVVAGTDVYGALIFRARIVDLKTGDIIRELQPPLPSKSIEARFPEMRLTLLKGSASLPEFADISADGTLAASVTTDKEVLVWSLVDGSEVVRFTVPSERSKLPHVKFAAGNRLLTYLSGSRSGKQESRSSVACWELPSLKRVYELTSSEDAAGSRDLLRESTVSVQHPTKVRSLLATSPNQRFAALDAVNSVRLIDTATGEIRGDLPISIARSPDDESADQALFSADGKRLFALFRQDRRSAVFLWDLETGRELSSFEVEGTYFVTDWVSPEQVLCTSDGYLRDSVLVDTARHCIVWKLKGNRMPLLGVGNGTFVSTHESGSRDQRGVMATKFQFPDAAALREIKSVMPTPLPPFAGPGSQMSVEFGELSGQDAKRESIVAATDSILRRNGMSIGTRDGLSLRISLELVEASNDTYRVTQYGRFGPVRDLGTINVNSRWLEARRVLLNRAGNTLWSERCSLYDGPGLFFFVTVKPGNSIQSAVQGVQQDRLSASFERRLKDPLPRVMYPQPRFGESNELGIGSSSLYDSKTFEADVADFFNVWMRKSDTRFILNLRDATSKQQAELAAMEPSALQQRLSWVPALKRATVGVRWGFGVQLAQVPKESLIKTQSNSFMVMDSLHDFTGGVASQLVARMSDLSATGTLGQFPASSDARVSQPVLLGGGNRKQLVEAARAVGLDLLVIAHFTGTTTGKNSSPAMVIRLINTDTEEEAFASDRVTNRSGVGTAADVAGILVDTIMVFAREKLVLQSLDTATDAEIKDRLAVLEKSGPGLPAAACVELLAWKARNALPDAQRRAILKKISSDTSFDLKLFSTVPADRAEAVNSLKK